MENKIVLNGKTYELVEDSNVESFDQADVESFDQVDVEFLEDDELEEVTGGAAGTIQRSTSFAPTMNTKVVSIGRFALNSTLCNVSTSGGMLSSTRKVHSMNIEGSKYVICTRGNSKSAGTSTVLFTIKTPGKTSERWTVHIQWKAIPSNTTPSQEIRQYVK